MRDLTADEVMWISGGSEATKAAGAADGQAVGEAIMKGAKIAATVSGVLALAIVLSASA
jgi:hypothetical protein